MSSDIKQTLRKIHALSVEGGSDGEKASAQIQLDRLLKKYGLSLSDVIDEAKDLVWFLCRNKNERQLLAQIVAKVLDNSTFFFRKVKQYVFVELTKAEKAEIDFLFAEYKRAYKKEMEIFFNAFIQKNRLFATTKIDDSNEEEKELTLEEKQRIQKILQMAQGMSAMPVNRKRLHT